MALLIASFVATLLLDQWSKREVLLRLGHRPVPCTPYLPYLQIRYVRNVANRYQHSSKKKLLIALWFTSVVSAMMLRSLGPWFHSSVSILGLGFAFGGAAGNLCDIVCRDSVIDFLDFGWWPVFNVADIAIPFGLLLAFRF